MIDIIIRRGLLINGDIVDIFIDNGVIIEINKDAQKKVVARKEINLYGKYYVSPGWIDIHTHCFEKYKLYSDNPDMIGYRTGVTTVVDAGTSGANDICEFYEKAKEYNTQGIINAMRNNDIFIITHPGDKGDVYIEEIAKVAKETNTRLEINSSHGYLNVEQLKKIKHLGNTFIIGSDAHIPNNVGNFDKAMKTIKEAKLDLSFVENIRV